MARIPGFHPGGPGSIPGVGEKFFCFSPEALKIPSAIHYMQDDVRDDMIRRCFLLKRLHFLCTVKNSNFEKL